METVQSTEPVKPNPYLPKDPPNPYLPQQVPQESQESHHYQEQRRDEPAYTEQHQQQEPSPVQQQQHHEQQQQPRSQEDINKVTGKLDQLTFKVEAVRNQQDSLAHSLSQVLSQVSDMRQPADNNELTQEIKSALHEVRVVKDSVNEFRRVVMEELSAVNKLVSDLKGHVSAEQGNTYNNVARLIREVQQQVTTVQTIVEVRTHVHLIA